MKRTALIPLLLAAGAAAQATPVRLDDVVRERLAEADSPVCVAVGVVGSATRTAFACSPGAGAVSFDADSIFAIGSVTKGLTGLLLADMVVRGELGIDDAASKHSRPGAKLPTRAGREITLRDLVTHTSGLPRTPPGFEPRDPANPYGHFDVDALYASLARTELARDIGSRYEYSNLGFMWLSEMLSRRAGKAYEQLLRERILEPLGMTSTGITPSREQQARTVMGHDASYRIVPHWTIGANLGGVGLVRSNLADMLRLAEALAGVRSTPLDAAIDLALRPPAPRATPDLGYAWNIRGEGEARRYDHGGGAGGFVAHVAFNRERKAASVVLADAATSIFDLSLHLVDPGYHLRRRLEARPLEARKRREYLGSYALENGSRVKVREDGERLVGQAGRAAFELFHQGADAFFAQVADAQLVFSRGHDGKVDGLTLYLDGRDSRAVIER
jgi:CubicO group peptidase (beta-lactamase class C family)